MNAPAGIYLFYHWLHRFVGYRLWPSGDVAWRLASWVPPIFDARVCAVINSLSPRDQDGLRLRPDCRIHLGLLLGAVLALAIGQRI